MLLTLISTLAFLFPFDARSASSISCFNGEITSHTQGVLSKDKQKVCFIKLKKNSFFISRKCKDSEQCRALEKQNIYIKINDLISEYGKPGFKLCKIIGGKPSLVNLSMRGEKINTDKCTFSDNSFVSTDYLFELYFRN